MVDVTKHLAYWREGAAEDWEAAELLLANGRVRQALFFYHLAVEKGSKRS